MLLIYCVYWKQIEIDFFDIVCRKLDEYYFLIEAVAMF